MISTPVLYPVPGLTLHSNYRSYLSSLQHDPKVNYYIKAVSDSFTSMADDILGGYGAAQLQITNAGKPTDVIGKFAAVCIGDAKFIYITAGINMIFLLLVLVEAVRTRFRDWMPLFDYLDTKSVIIAASGGRGDIADESRLRHENKGQAWSADPGDRLVGKIRVRVKMPDSVGTISEPVMVLESSGADEKLKLRGEGASGKDQTSIELLSLPTSRDIL